jgi:ubiquinone/menaquinone biosynthesis C-methylase UbiE
MLDRLQIPGLGGWSEDPLWASFYDWTVEHRRVGGAMWKLGIGSDLGLLYAAAAEIGRQPAGSAILDVPCGGGVALRGLRQGQGVRYVAADIAQTMLDRTFDAGHERGVADQMVPALADVGDLPFSDGEFDLVVSFTGLHCFPDPHLAMLEMGRVTHAGGVLSGSALLNPESFSIGGLRTWPVRQVGRAGAEQPRSATRAEVLDWMAEAGFLDVTLKMSGAIGYFRGVKAAPADSNVAG